MSIHQYHIEPLHVDPSTLKVSIDILCSVIPSNPGVAIIAGSGMRSLCESWNVLACLPYSSVPLLPQTSVAGHAGQIIVTKLANDTMLVFSGRFHVYEGLSLSAIVTPIILSRSVGIRRIILINAAGALNEHLRIGEVVLATGILNMTFRSIASTSTHTHKLENRWTYLVANGLTHEGIPFQRGTYIAVHGPSYETVAEARFYRRFGECIGMSTIHEIEACLHYGLQPLVVSVITNVLAQFKRISPVKHSDVLLAVQEALPLIRRIVEIAVTTPDSE